MKSLRIGPWSISFPVYSQNLGQSLAHSRCSVTIKEEKKEGREGGREKGEEEEKGERKEEGGEIYVWMPNP